MSPHDEGSRPDNVRLAVTTHSTDETQELGTLLGTSAQPGDVYLLLGTLGAGKTCLTQGILHGLGSDELARSPTFVLIAEHRARLTLYHMDLYRLDSAFEIADLGLDEYLYGDGLCVVEWADKALDQFPIDHLRVEIEVVSDTERRITMEAVGRPHEERIEAMRQTWKEKRIRNSKFET